jgi:hypothetical protein
MSGLTDAVTPTSLAKDLVPSAAQLIRCIEDERVLVK